MKRLKMANPPVLNPLLKMARPKNLMMSVVSLITVPMIPAIQLKKRVTPMKVFLL